MSTHCTCGVLSVGETRNWDPDCPEHGTGSAWWRSDLQKAKRAVQDRRLRYLQAMAKARRRAP